MNKICPVCHNNINKNKNNEYVCLNYLDIYAKCPSQHYIEYEDAISCYYFYNNIMYYGFVNDRQKYFVLYAYNNYRFSEELINMPYNNEPIISLIEKYSKLLIFQ